MTKLKEFRENAPSWMKLSFLDVLETLDTSKTKKFLPMLSKISDNHYEDNNNTNHSKDLRNELDHRMPFLKGSFQDLNHQTLLTFYNLLQLIPSQLLETSFEFIDMYEKHQISNLDINQIKSINDIEKIVNLISIKNIGKEYSKQIHVELENERWLVIRPLTHESSLKYGANTRWCTASKNNPYQFFRYTEQGVLVYCINKETGYKVAFHMFKEFDKFHSISFWNSADDQIDSLTAEIDYEVFNLIKQLYSNQNTKTNKELGGEFWKKSYENYLENDGIKSSESSYPVPDEPEYLDGPETEMEEPTVRTVRLVRN